MQNPPFFDYNIHRNEILGIGPNIKRALDNILLIRPLISVDALLKEGVTDLNKINGTLVAQVSQSLLNDYAVFTEEAKEINNHLLDYIKRGDQIFNEKLNLDATAVDGVYAEGLIISQKYQHWFVRYTGIIIPLMNDLITLINAGRNTDRQIPLIILEQQEIQ